MKRKKDISNKLPASRFSAERLETINSIERDHFWFLGRRSLVLWLMRRFVDRSVKTLLDVGCGTGFNLQYWGEFSGKVIGLDRLAQHTVHNHAHKTNSHMVTSDVCALPVLSHSAEVAVALDVLEHVPDKIMLSEIRRCLVNDGLLFITVPATEWLWRARDESAGHLRRYNKKTLSLILEGAGFEILYMKFYQSLLFPLIALSRIIGRNRKSTTEIEEKPNQAVHALLNAITKVEVKMTQLGISFPWGSTLIAVVRKI